MPHYWQDIFWAGFRIPSTFRQLFAEGALSAAFIPLLTRVKEREGEEAAREAGAAVLRALSLASITAIGIGIAFAPKFVPLLLNFPEEPGSIFSDANWRVDAGVWATQSMFPFLLFVGWAAWTMGVLNTYRVFFVPAVAPTLFNCSLIVGCILGAHWHPNNGFALMQVIMSSVLIGGFLQFAIQIGPAVRIHYFPLVWASPFHPKVGLFLRMLAPSIFGLAIYQINALITQMYFASQYGVGGISQMNYAFLVMQFPLGVVGVALATASFPRMAQYIEQHRMQDAANTFSDVMKYLMLIMLPASVGLIALGRTIVDVIYNRGNFRAENWLQPTYEVLIVYSAGLIFYTSVKIMVRTFQARHDFRTPVVIGALSVAVNITLCSLFVKLGWPLWSMALSSFLASGIQMLLLGFLLKKRMDIIRVRPLLRFFVRIAAASTGMGAVCWLFQLTIPHFGEAFLWKIVYLFTGVILGMVVYFGLGWKLFRHELKAMLKLK